jgi:tetratricopeptide (TPR) repeat protein
MNISLTLLLAVLLQSHAAMIEDAFQKADYASAEKLIRTHIPEGPRQSLFLARAALLQNKQADARKFYDAVLKAPSASVREKTDAYVGILRMLEVDVYKNRKELLALCENAVKELPEGSNVQRMFRLQLAGAYERLISVPPVGNLQRLMLPGCYLPPDKPQTKALAIYMDILNSQKPVPQLTICTATYGAAKIWRRLGQYEKAEELLQKLWKSDLPIIEKGNCAVALTEHYIAVAPIWHSKTGSLWLQINALTTSEEILPEYRGRILCTLARAAARKGYFSEAFNYYNRAANDTKLTPWQRAAILQQYINTAKQYKQHGQEYQARSRIFYDGRNYRGVRVNQLPQMVTYLAKNNNQASFNELMKYASRTNIKLTAAEVSKYRKMFRENRKKR